MNTKILGIIPLVIIGGGAAFYGGMTYAQMSRGQGGNFADLSREERQIRFANGRPTGIRNAGGAGGGFIAGEIFSKDETGVTIKMQDGSTKIILVGGSVQIMKTASGSADDLTVGTQVFVTGLTNGDGSVTAESVQIRPVGFIPGDGSMRTIQ